MTGEVGDTAAALGAGFARDDAFVKLLGAELVAVGPGFAELAMTVRHDHLNFNGSCHGGAIFALADTAFGFASNSHGVVAAGIDAHITFPAAARLGDRLTARSEELTRSRRLATYKVTVAKSDGGIVASFTGTVYVTEKTHGMDR
jgi:acyl-CoA thioesterase